MFWLRSTHPTTPPALGVVFLLGLFLGLFLPPLGQLALLPGQEGGVGDLGEVGAERGPLLLHQLLYRDLILLVRLLHVLQTHTHTRCRQSREETEMRIVDVKCFGGGGGKMPEMLSGVSR